MAKVTVTHKDQVKQLPVMVVAGNGPNLLGRAWLKELEMGCLQLHKVEQHVWTLQDVLESNEEVFKEELGTWKGPPAKIYVKENATPRFYKSRPVPYAMKKKVETELERLTKQGIIEPVKFSEWAAPIVPVLKPDDTVRICGDYKLTVNQVLKLEQYPIPTVEDVLWGARVIIPPPGRRALLQQLHQGHVGITRMKALARSYFWWPKLDHDTEVTVKGCNICQQHRSSPEGAPLHPWEWPSRPWQRLHIDYAGPFMGAMFLIIMDAHSKWMDAYPVKTTTSTTTIECLRRSFSSQGLPETIVSDNASCFMSGEFKGFLEKNVSRVLFNYRITPQSTNGLSPAEMLQGRRLRSTLDLVRPNIRAKIERMQWRQKEHHDRRRRERSFLAGDAVMTRNFSYGPKWIPGFIVKSTGPLSYQVRLNGGLLVRRHVDQILRSEQKKDSMELPAPEIPLVLGEGFAEAGGSPILGPEVDRGDSEGEVPEDSTVPGMDITPVPEVVTVTPESPSVVPLRCSKRALVKPSYLKDYQCYKCMCMLEDQHNLIAG
ncbi:uncharacterized protein K02A2.6-like [Protopterus annectens]|uniref:uncharacterized protein K02A2.6-like n=1 Tax=Protopterus annectens TaxID=7888 RepID=UPI001CF9BF74|nr:uncharacterized protein K02A2.6-like [Protopterus annectens]